MVQAEWICIVSIYDSHTEVCSVEWSGEAYEFDETCVFESKETGMLFYAEDAGCSCPSPFENTTFEKLTPILRLQDWIDHTVHRMNSRYTSYSNYDPTDQVVYSVKIVSQKLQELRRLDA